MKNFMDENFLLQTETAQKFIMNIRQKCRLSIIIAT